MCVRERECVCVSECVCACVCMQVTDAAVIATEMETLASDTRQLDLLAASEHRRRNEERNQGVCNVWDEMKKDHVEDHVEDVLLIFYYGKSS